ncbi:MAG: hypothetical protein J6R18_09855 [Kiritimatiellae bacterium]|nr:hypothetical protein [Kiritimatiellia bacterium]
MSCKRRWPCAVALCRCENKADAPTVQTQAAPVRQYIMDEGTAHRLIELGRKDARKVLAEAGMAK